MTAGFGKWLFRLYALVALAFIFAPPLTLVIMSFNADAVQTFPIREFSVKWYAAAFTNGDFHIGFWNSLTVAAVVAPVATALALASAYLLGRRQPRNSALYLLGVTLPALVPPILSGLSLLMFYERLRIDGSIWAIMLAHTCYCSPFALGFLRGSFDGLNPELEQAARNLGAGPVRVVLQVIIPQLRPALIGAAALCFLLSWDEFTLAWFVGGFVKTLPAVIYVQLGSSFNPSLNAVGAATLGASCLLLAIAVIGTRFGIGNSGGKALARKSAAAPLPMLSHAGLALPANAGGFSS